jgi:hypothetical protein
LIAENRQLIDQVRKHDNEIKELTKKMSQLNNTAAHDSNDDSDDSSVPETSAGGISQKEEDSILPSKAMCTSSLVRRCDPLETTIPMVIWLSIGRHEVLRYK